MYIDFFWCHRAVSEKKNHHFLELLLSGKLQLGVGDACFKRNMSRHYGNIPTAKGMTYTE